MTKENPDILCDKCKKFDKVFDNGNARLDTLTICNCPENMDDEFEFYSEWVPYDDEKGREEAEYFLNIWMKYFQLKSDCEIISSNFSDRQYDENMFNSTVQPRFKNTLGIKIKVKNNILSKSMKIPEIPEGQERMGYIFNTSEKYKPWEDVKKERNDEIEIKYFPINDTKLTSTAGFCYNANTEIALFDYQNKRVIITKKSEKKERNENENH